MSNDQQPKEQRRTLTLTNEELAELSGFRRGFELIAWLKENRFKFVLDRYGYPRVDRRHYEWKMGVPDPAAPPNPWVNSPGPNWDSLKELEQRKPGRPKTGERKVKP